MQYKEDTDQLSIENDNLKQKLELYTCAQAQDRTAHHQQEAMVTIINNIIGCLYIALCIFSTQVIRGHHRI